MVATWGGQLLAQIKPAFGDYAHRGLPAGGLTHSGPGPTKFRPSSAEVHANGDCDASAACEVAVHSCRCAGKMTARSPPTGQRLSCSSFWRMSRQPATSCGTGVRLKAQGLLGMRISLSAHAAAKAHGACMQMQRWNSSRHSHCIHLLGVEGDSCCRLPQGDAGPCAAGAGVQPRQRSSVRCLPGAQPHPTPSGSMSAGPKLAAKTLTT